MKKFDLANLGWALPAAVALLAAVAAAVWLSRGPGQALDLRKPGADASLAGGEAAGGTNPVLAGKLIRADGQPADLPGAWPRFRGTNLDNLSTDPTPLARTWDAAGPKQLWAIDVGEGYAGAVVRDGRVYVMDYDQPKRQDALRCLSLADGKEVWRYTYPVPLKRFHGLSRTVPTLADKYVVAMGPKCHVVCLDATTGELRWGLDLVRQFGTTVPQWYAGQCPLVDQGRVILAVGGKEALFVAVELETGKVLWQTPNPNKWQMTHSSVVPMEFAGQRMYVYCANLGVVGIAAKDGALLWETTEWQITLATIPAPVPLADGKIFLSGGYGAGSLMLQLKSEGGRLAPQTLFRLEPKVYGATQHTPIPYKDHLYGVREPDGQFVCLDLNGKVVWASGPNHKFGLGPFLIANGLIFALNDSGKLTLMEATTDRFNLLAQAQVLQGHESWGPMALAGGRLIARDTLRMVCLEVAGR